MFIIDNTILPPYSSDQELIPSLDNHEHNDCNTLTQTQRVALHLYDMGLNVFPVRYASKKGFKYWDKLQYSRLSLHGKADLYGLIHLTSGLCNLAVMNGRTSNNLCCIDCETPESFKFHKEQFRNKGISLWTVQSGKGGHIYFQSKKGVVQNVLSGILLDTEIRCNNNYQLIPPSIHPNGSDYRWDERQNEKPPIIELDQIDWLQDKNGAPVHLALEMRGSHQSQVSKDIKTRLTTVAVNRNLPNDEKLNRLMKSTIDYLESGHLLPQGERNNKLFTAACDMAACGYTRRDADVLISIASRSGLGSKEISKTIDSAFSEARLTWKNSQSQYRKQSPLCTYAQAWIEVFNWLDVRTGTTDYKVAIALLECARKGISERGIFRASQREVAVVARVKKETAAIAISRLMEKYQFIRYVTNSANELVRDEKSGSYLYAFQVGVIQQGRIEFKRQLTVANSFSVEENISKRGATNGIPYRWSDRVALYLKKFDATERSALGVNGIKIYQAMESIGRPATPKEIADKARFVKSTGNSTSIYYYLKKLQNFGMVERTPKGYQVIPIALENIDILVAEQAGTRGNGERRKQKFAEERAVYIGSLLMREREKTDLKNLYNMAFLSMQ